MNTGDRAFAKFMDEMNSSLLPRSPVRRYLDCKLLPETSTVALLIELQSGQVCALAITPGLPIACSLHEREPAE